MGSHSNISHVYDGGWIEYGSNEEPSVHKGGFNKTADELFEETMSRATPEEQR